MRVVVALGTVVALAFPISASAELNMRPGLWESLMTVGGNQMPPDQKCYLQKDIDALDKFQRGTQPQGSNPCSTSGYGALGNSMSYTLTCEINGKKSISAVTMNYDGNRISGQITGVDGTVTQVLNTRIADCSESSFPN